MTDIGDGLPEHNIQWRHQCLASLDPHL